jgi:polysaccharide pyruvyl transferase WcaK-like protein
VKVAILNVKYSPNLGDGLLAECLECELRRHHPCIELIPIDLAGRTKYDRHGRHRAAAMRTLEWLPQPLRRAAALTVLSMLSRAKLRPAFRMALTSCNAAVIGGGNLFADDDLNFPVKIASGLAEARKRALPVAVHAVGVADNWSSTGQRLFTRALGEARIAAIAVRDERSQEIWNRRLGERGIRPADIARDPGLLAARCYTLPENRASRRRVALCITNPLAVRYHGGAAGGDEALGAWYGATIAALATDGWEVALFTNGSPEDRAYLDRQQGSWSKLAAPGIVRAVPAFARPADLVAELSQATVVIAHRMHACIAAYSCKVPPIGLRWDPKLDSFFALSDRSDFMVDTASVDAAVMVALVNLAAAEGIEPVRHERLLDEASASIAELGRTLRLAVAAA